MAELENRKSDVGNRDSGNSAGATAPPTAGRPIPTSESGIHNALRSLLRDGGFRAGAPAAVSMPPGEVFFQTLDTDLLQLDDVRRVLKFETEGDFPFPPEDLVVDVCSVRKLPENRQSILAAAVSHEALERTQQALREAGIACVRVDAAACALHGLACRSFPGPSHHLRRASSRHSGGAGQGAKTPGEAISSSQGDAAGDLAARREDENDAGARMISLHLSEDEVILAIGQEGLLVSVRSFSPAKGGAEELVREMELSWREAFGSGLAGSAARCVLCGDGKLIAGLADALAKSTGLEVRAMNPVLALGAQPGLAHPDEKGNYTKRPIRRLLERLGLVHEIRVIQGVRDEGFQGDSSYAVAVGMALAAAGEMPGANFLTAEAATASAARKTRRGLIVAAVLIAAVAAVWSLGMFLKLHSLTVQRAYLRSETADIAAKVFPSERPAGNALPQVVLARVEDLLKEERKAHSTLSPLAGAVPLPLRALQRVQACMPPGIRVKITELSVSERSVRLAGTTDSYKDFEELRKQFESAPEFENVTFTNPEGARNAQSIPFVAAFFLRAEKDG